MADYQFQPDMNDPVAKLRRAMDSMDGEVSIVVLLAPGMLIHIQLKQSPDTQYRKRKKTIWSQQPTLNLLTLVPIQSNRCPKCGATSGSSLPLCSAGRVSHRITSENIYHCQWPLTPFPLQFQSEPRFNGYNYVGRRDRRREETID
jgi:hypothetical protein